MKREVPFVANEPDDLHCLQATYMMIAKYFDPNFDIPMNEWSKITCFDKSTWASAGLLWFKNNGYDVKHITLFDYHAFIEGGSDYLEKSFGKEVSEWQIAHSNIPAEVDRAKALLESGVVEEREPTQQDIKSLIAQGYLLRAIVNSRKLNHKSGYVGHAIVLFNCDETGVTIHDPGLPPIPNRKVTWDDFEAAWADPNPQAKELDAIKK